MKKKTIYTHLNLDLEATCCVWSYLNIIDKDSSFNMKFVNANWDGKEMKIEDVAVDINAGGKGTKGNSHKSAFKIISMQFSDEERDILKSLIEYVDIKDIKGKYNSSRIETFCGLGNIFRAIQNQCKGNDYKTYKTMELVLNGMLNNARNRYGNLEENLEKVKWVGHVAIVKDIKGINGKVFRMGAKAIVYSQGNDIGAIRNSDFENIKLDGLMVRKFIACRGEHWNYREGGNFICWGCRKSPADERSKIKDEELAEVINLEITQQLYPLIGDKIEEF